MSYGPRGEWLQFTILKLAMDQLATVDTSFVLEYRNVVVVSVMSSTNHDLLVTFGSGLIPSVLEKKMRSPRSYG